MASDLTILHLSDLQFGCNHRYPEGKDSYRALLGKLSTDLDHLAEEEGVVPNAIVVTGDLAEWSMPSEYEQVRVFLEGLVGKLELGKERVIVVPGNHDVSRKLCQAKRLEAEATDMPFDEPYFAKFQNYQCFFNQFYGDLQLFDDQHLFQVYPFVEEKIVIVGFNSCIKESELDEDHYGHIGLEQVLAASARCDDDDVDPGRACLRIAAMHHNFTCSSKEDNENLRDADEIWPALRKGGFHVVLHGHRHIANFEQRKSGGAEHPTSIISTGSAGLDGETLPEHPNQYQIVKIENHDDVTLYLRRYSAREFGLAGEGDWLPDARKDAKGGVMRDTLGLRGRADRTELKPGPTGVTAARERYVGYVAEEHRHFPLRGLGTDVRAPIDLEPMCISLRTELRHVDLDREGRGGMPEPMPIGQVLRFCDEQGYAGLVVLGDPGSGKTTLLKYLTLCLAHSKPEAETGVKPGRVPIFVPLREVEDFGVPLPDVVQALYQPAQLELPADFFAALLDSGRCLLLLDGFDEVATPERRVEAREWIERERNKRPDNRFVLTSRFAGYREKPARLPEQYLEVHVLDFSDDDVRRFVKRWYGQVETKQRGATDFARKQARDLSDDLLRHVLDRDQPLHGLARNPLMLQIICLVHRSRGAMPRRRTELYEQCIDVLLEKWDEAKGIELYLSAAEARHVLRPFALWLHQEEGRTYAEAEQVMEVIQPHLARVKRRNHEAQHQLDRILLSVRDRSGLVTGHGVAQYGFQHLSFQECLAAEEIQKQELHEKLVNSFGSTWWREPTLLAMGLDAPKFQEAFFRFLIPSERLGENLDLALACVRDALAPDPAPFAESLRDPELPSRSRYNCAMLLKEIGGEQAIQALEAALDTSDREVADAARGTLVQLGALGEPEPEVSLSTRLAAKAEAIVVAKDGSELILVPAGEFIMGSEEGDPDEHPQRVVSLDAYYIAKNPVANAQYRRFLEETKHRRPHYWGEGRYNRPYQPVVGVSWCDAIAYCQWAGLRLPTEAEWEKAARGTDGREYPWGNDDPTDKLCNFGLNVGAPSEIGSYPDGASPYGCLDMVGNVYEWCVTKWQDSYGEAEGRRPQRIVKRAVRGGAHYRGVDAVRCAYREGWPSGFLYHDLGFRCAW